jgi:hypothetical protein
MLRRPKYACSARVSWPLLVSANPHGCLSTCGWTLNPIPTPPGRLRFHRQRGRQLKTAPLPSQMHQPERRPQSKGPEPPEAYDTAARPYRLRVDMYSSAECQNSLSVGRALASVRIASRSLSIADCRAAPCRDQRYSLIRISATGRRLASVAGSLANARSASIKWRRSSISHLPYRFPRCKGCFAMMTADRYPRDRRPLPRWLKINLTFLPIL